MNTPQQHPPEQEKLHDIHHLLTPLAIIGGAVALILVGGIFLTVKLEQQQQAKDTIITLASPSPITSEDATPTLAITYQPQVAGMSKEQAIATFHAVTLDRDIFRADKHLVRWEQEIISWRLRGQFTSEDRQCMEKIVEQFNPAMKTSKLQEMSASTGAERRAGIEIYLLPPNQFSSVNPDIRPEQTGQMFYSRSGYNLISSTIVVDSTQPIGGRCLYFQELMLQTMGLAFPIKDASLIVPIPSPNFIHNARYSASDLEMLRILYSPLLTPGLTKQEIDRRLLQD